MTNIWVPGSHEIREATAVRNAVRTYDPDLSFGRNEETGDWCIFLRQGTNKAASTNDLPILGFGKDIPAPEAAMTRLLNSDARRRGTEILDELNKNNQDIEDIRKRKADEGIGLMAEGFDWGFRKMGKHPSARIFVPGG